MKKFVKFLFTTFSLVALGASAFYFVKKYICKSDEDDEMDDFVDFDDLDEDDQLGEFPDLDPKTVRNKSTREYVTLNMGEAVDKMEGAVEDMKEKASDAVESVKETVSDTFHDVKDTIRETIDDAKDSSNVTVIDLNKEDAE